MQASTVSGYGSGIGPAVTTVEVGGSTFLAGFGALAEKVAVPEHRLAPKPANASFEEAAAVPLAGLPALQAVRDHGGVQIAKHLGAHVTGVCSGPNRDDLRTAAATRSTA